MFFCKVALLKFGFFLLLLITSANSPASTKISKVAVLYPEAKDNYARVFSHIIDGTKQHDDLDIILKKIVPSTSADEVDSWLKNNNIRAIIALGQLSYSLSKKLNTKIPIIAGALVLSKIDDRGISLAGDPDIFFSRLTELAPDISRVFIIYNQKNSGWLVERAKKISKKYKIKIVAYEAKTIQQGVRLYDKALNSAKNNKDAIWIPLDRIVPINLVLPKILKVAWEKQIVVFSNNPIHTRRGTLFALFPDHFLMGESLAQLAKDQINNPTQAVIQPAKNLKIAVNKRTASHLGLQFSKSQQRLFDIIFPLK